MKIHPTSSRRQLGLTLVELMVALVLGLVVIGAVVNLFLTNRQTYRATENLARMQENLRFAFELMARDVREAGATACGATNFANVLNGTPSNWSWQGETLIAYAPGATIPSPAPDNVAAGSPVLSIAKGTDPANEIRVIKHAQSSDSLTLSSTANLQPGDILFVCKTPYAAIFQATDVDANNRTVSHAKSDDVTSGNCLDYFPPASTAICKIALGSPDEYISFTDGTLVKFQLIRWYVGTNDRGGTSLYRKVSDEKRVEMVPDIDQLTLSFLYTDINGSRYLPLDSVPDWTKVQAVRIMVRSVSTDKVGTDGQPLRREYPFTIALRNRLN
jgi:type IV pilus assembly protein PilW